ncbi:DUF4350 domain-containing protein [Pedobacter sp. SYP-B3415]|uniref:DUF4350 domain-containing protein n=1 Tax=Pedobacter sp. SYP-B3415 TaxID=2496641 RepID=UPI00101CB9B8|nr:DUF4350 domain-containing protein [Pedobacter sp. SYP-B3415]
MRAYRIYMAIGIVLLVIYLVAQYNKPVPTNWSRSFSSVDKIPFGTYILSRELKAIVPGAQIIKSNTPVYNTLKNKNSSNTSYLIVAGSIELSREDWRELKAFAAAGNTVFIASYSFGKVLDKELKITSSYRLNVDLSGMGDAVNFTNPALRAPQPYNFDKRIGDQFFSKIDSAQAVVLGTTENNKVNFVRYPIKKGSIYLLPDPSFFSNYQLLKEDGADYAARSLSYLSGSRALIFDTYYSEGIKAESSPMRVFFKYAPLRHAYYLAIAGILLFVLFETKRRQRIIPIDDPLENSSVAFSKVVGSVYFHEANHLDIARKRLTYLKDYLRTRFFIDTQQLTSELLEVKTGVKPATAKLLLRRMQDVEQASAMTGGELLAFSETVDQFYTQTRKI